MKTVCVTQQYIKTQKTNVVGFTTAILITNGLSTI